MTGGQLLERAALAAHDHLHGAAAPRLEVIRDVARQPRAVLTRIGPGGARREDDQQGREKGKGEPTVTRHEFLRYEQAATG